MLRTQEFIETKISNAEYKFDKSVNEWVGWINDFPGIYAQGRTIESVRNELVEMLEDYLFISLQEGRDLRELGIKVSPYVKTYQSQGAH